MNYMTHRFIILSVLFMCTWYCTIRCSAQLKYPQARTQNVIDNFHGTAVSDPYRWMENAESKELQQWIKEENELSSEFFKQLPDREKIKERLTALWNYPKYSTPVKHGKRYFFTKNDGLQNQSVLYTQEGLKDLPTVVIDPNSLSNDGTVSLSSLSYTKDGSLLAYSISRSGSDLEEIHIKNIETGKEYEDVVRWCKYVGIAWTHDNKGFYYNRFPTPGSVKKGEENFYNKVYYHKLGTHQSTDKLVYEDKATKDLIFSPSMTDDGKYLILTVWHGTDPKTRIYYHELDNNSPFYHLIDTDDAYYNVIASDSTVFYIETNFNAPRGRVIAVDLDNPEPQQWRTIIPENTDVLSSVSVINNQFVGVYMHDAHSILEVYALDGKYVRRLELPTLGSIGTLTGLRENSEMFFSFTSYVYPTVIFRYDLNQFTLTPFRRSEIRFDPSGYETEQVFYNSKDGTRIPMFLTHKKNLQFTGTTPTLLYGYGGFNISMTPSFSSWRLLWLEHGGIFAVANIRGGNEYGEEWHRAGILEKKQTVFDDFIAAAKWLVDKKYTQPSKIAIIGESNGGLLVSACMLQQPSLCGAVICRVPVTDMLRYHKLSVGRFWTGEYGNAEENADHFKFLYQYSPLHNVKKGAMYPPILITTADHDDRVVPAHAMKFAATLQSQAAGTNPILLRIETKAGHGGGKPTSKVLDEYTDIFAFLSKIFSFPLTPTP